MDDRNRVVVGIEEGAFGCGGDSQGSVVGEERHFSRFSAAAAVAAVLANHDLPNSNKRIASQNGYHGLEHGAMRQLGQTDEFDEFLFRDGKLSFFFLLTHFRSLTQL